MEKPFEFRVGEREISAGVGRMVCVLFRRQQEVDYLAVNISQDEEPAVLRVFNNVELVRWVAGIAFHEDGIGLTTADGDTFHDQFGWYPPVVVKAKPSEAELEWFMDVNAGKIDDEWKEMEA